MPDMRAHYEHALAEVAEIKRALAERARHVAELEKRLMRQVEEGAGRGVARRDSAGPGPTRSDLARAVAAAEAEKALAQAEREQLDERERNIRHVERELAGLRVQLEKESRRLAGGNAPQQPAQPDLAPAAAALRRAAKPQ